MGFEGTSSPAQEEAFMMMIAQEGPATHHHLLLLLLLSSSYSTVSKVDTRTTATEQRRQWSVARSPGGWVRQVEKTLTIMTDGWIDPLSETPSLLEKEINLLQYCTASCTSRGATILVWPREREICYIGTRYW